MDRNGKPVERLEGSGTATPLAVVGGSAAWRLLERAGWEVRETVTVETPFGPSPPVRTVRWEGGAVARFVSRHGEDRYAVSAPFVNYRAIVWALKSLGTERILAWSGPGSLRPKRFRPGDLVIPDDLVDETRNRPSTFFAGKGWGFIRVHPVFCPEACKALRQGTRDAGRGCRDGGTYVCTEGPRLETPAEIRKCRVIGGDLVGMTLCPEAFLARELEMCYAPLCYVTNFAEGLVRRPAKPGVLFGGMLTDAERERVDECVEAFPAVFGHALARLAVLPGRCICRQAMLRYRREGVLGEDWREWVGGEAVGCRL
ncbi:MAG: MTAP family purine nucleoside phosphorylase [Acidobacteria bacterium]|nr:MTAP family purine nucleoside phosphorylase [Acidobacteriota bacterium]